MSNDLKVSLIITTYNWPKALELALQSVVLQSTYPDEVIIADDGSGQETAEVVKSVLYESRLRWCHIWQEDQGVRQSRIKNLAVKNSRYPYLIFADHDAVLHTDFVRDHLSMAREDHFLQGKRCLLPKYYTQKLFENGAFSGPKLWLKGLGNRKNILRIPALGRLLGKPKKFETSLRGCNLSMFKEDFLRVDGFDEAFDGSWGREDSDLCYRLFHCGIKVINLWFMALQYHLNHGAITNWDMERLDSELKRNIEEKRVMALRGFSTLSNNGGIIASSDDF